MKTILVLTIMLTATVSEAAEYNCAITDGNSAPINSFQINTVKEENKFINLNADTSVGCVVLRTQPELLTCGLASPDKYSLFTTADNGTSTLSLRAMSGANTIVLNCVKAK